MRSSSVLRRRLARLAAGFAAIALVAVAVAVVRDRRQRRPLARNVVVLLADTLRADHLSLHGYRRRTSPRLDALAAERGIVFENARSQAPCTFPSVNSLLTSRSPLRFVTAAPQSLAIPPEVPTLATLLSAAGYSTAAVSASPIVRATPSKLNAQGGFDAGFDSFDETCEWKSARCVTRRAIEALSKLREPFLLYAHYLDPHDPYRLPADIRPRFARGPPPASARDFVAAGNPWPIGVRIYEQKLDAGLVDGELDYLIARYDDEIRYWDRHVVRMIAELDRRGLSERTVVAVVADHGESFLEHGHVMHCRTLYDSELHVPMVFLVPGSAPRRVAAPVSNLDVVPTLLDLVGRTDAPADLEGSSLRELLAGRPAGGSAAPYVERVQRSWWISQRAVSDGRFKLIGYSNPPGSPLRRVHLFDLAADPGETVDLATRERAALGRLRGELTSWMRLDPAPGRGAEDEVEKRLRAVGYLQ